MELSDLRKQQHLSASGISDYIDCSLLYKFGRVDRIKFEFTADTLEFGTVIHRTLDDFYMGRMLKRPIGRKELQDKFEQYWHEAACEKPNIRWSKEKTYESYLIQGRELVSLYLDALPAEEMQVLAIEEPFTFLIEGLDIPIIGAMDLIEQDEAGNIIITDFKTSSKLYSNDEAYKNAQLTLYNMAARANGYANREILLKLDCLIKTKTPKIDFVWTTRTEEDFQRARMKILRVADGIKKQVWIPNEGHWKCNGCSFADHCAKWFRGEVT
jgi:putative RecB family exonuclease